MSLGWRIGTGGATAVAGLICLLILGAATPASATTLRRMDLPDLVAAADRVVHVRALRNRVYWDPSHTRVFTDTVFEVLSDAKGGGPRQLTITQLGGSIDAVDMLVEGTPAFSVGEEVVLFTQMHPTGVRLVVGLSQGVMRIHEDPDTGGKFAVSEIAGGLNFVGGRPERTAAPLEALLDQVRQMAAGASGPAVSKKPEKPGTAPGGGKP